MVTKFIVIGQPRTGTTYLITLLNSHENVLCENELFNPRGIVRTRKAANDLSNEGLIRREADPLLWAKEFFEQKRSGTYQAIGFNLMLGHAVEVFDGLVRDGVKIIYLYRDNKLAQYLSWVKANSSKRWATTDSDAANAARREALEFRPRDYLLRMNDLATSDLMFRQYVVPSLGERVLVSEYVQLFRPETVDTLCEFLGIRKMTLTSDLKKQGADRIVDRIANRDRPFVRKFLDVAIKREWLEDELGGGRSDLAGVKAG